MKTYENSQGGTSDEEAFSPMTEREQVLDFNIVFHNERMNVWNLENTNILHPQKTKMG